MQDLNSLLKAKSVVPKWLPIAILVVAFFGFVDASYLAIEHYIGDTPLCTIIEGCDIVVKSKYSTLFGISVALLGALYYLTIATLVIAYFDKKNDILLEFIAWFTPFGLLASAWFVYVQLMILKAICIYCMGSVLTSTILAIFGLIIFFNFYRK